MNSFDLKKNIEDSIKDGLIITITTAGMLYSLKAANVKLPEASLDTINIMKFAGGIVGGFLVPCSLQKINQRVIQQQNCMALLSVIKSNDTIA